MDARRQMPYFARRGHKRRDGLSGCKEPCADSPNDASVQSDGPIRRTRERNLPFAPRVARYKYSIGGTARWLASISMRSGVSVSEMRAGPQANDRAAEDGLSI